ncbi:hypothetical protein YC2023_058716 [Brassica napus]
MSKCLVLSRRVAVYTHPWDHQLKLEWKIIRPDLGRIEKWVLRNAFDDEDKPYLPKPPISDLLR